MALFKEDNISFKDDLLVRVSINKAVKIEKMTDNQYHDYHEILYVVHGSSTQFINNESQQMHQGDIAVIKPGDTHTTYSSSETGCQIIVILFYPEALDFTSSPSDKSKYFIFFH